MYEKGSKNLHDASRHTYNCTLKTKTTMLNGLQKRSINTASILGISALISGGINLLMVPVITHGLSPGSFGIATVVIAATAILWPLANFNCQKYLSVLFFQKGMAFWSQNAFSWLMPSLIFSALIFSLVVFFKLPISENLDIPEEALVIAPIIVMTMVITQTAQTTFVLLSRPALSLVFEASLAILGAGLTLFAIFKLGDKWEARLYPAAAVGFIGAAISIFYLKNQKIIKLNIKKIEMLKSFNFGKQTFSNEITSHLVTHGDKIILGAISGTSAAGIYAVGYQFSSILLILIAILARAWSVHLYAMLSDSDLVGMKEIKKAFVFMWIIFGIITFIFILSCHIIMPYLIDNKYYGAIYIIMPLCCGYLLFFIQNTINELFYFFEKNTFFIKLSLVRVVLFFVICPTSAYYWGFRGVAYGYALLMLVLTLITFHYLRVVLREDLEKTNRQ